MKSPSYTILMISKTFSGFRRKMWPELSSFENERLLVYHIKRQQK